MLQEWVKGQQLSLQDGLVVRISALGHSGDFSEMRSQPQTQATRSIREPSAILEKKQANHQISTSSKMLRSVDVSGNVVPGRLISLGIRLSASGRSL